jgi:hypothetical protein
MPERRYSRFVTKEPKELSKSHLKRENFSFGSSKTRGSPLI